MSKNCIAVDESVLPLLGDSPEEIERHVLEIIVLELYRRHTISVGRAAELLAMDKLDFIRWSGSLGIPYFDLTLEAWDRELTLMDSVAGARWPPTDCGATPAGPAPRGGSARSG